MIGCHLVDLLTQYAALQRFVPTVSARFEAWRVRVSPSNMAYTERYLGAKCSLFDPDFELD